MKRCPFCAEEIHDKAIVCRFCGRELTHPSSSPLSIITFFIGSASLVAWFIPLFGYPVAIIALAFSSSNNKHWTNRAGRTMAIIGLVLTLINSAFGAYFGYMNADAKLSPTPKTIYATQAFGPNPAPPTSTPSCKMAALVTGSYAGQRICVYGNVTRQEFHVYNGTTRIFFNEKKGFFIVCEHCYYPDLEPGECVSVTGTVGLSTDKYPFIVARGLKSCP